MTGAGVVVVWCGALGALALAVPAALATARGAQRPGRASFSVWTVQAGAAFAAAAAGGAGPQALLASGAAVAAPGAILLATFVAALRRREEPGGRGRPWVERSCLAVCALALFGWWLTHNPDIAAVLVIVTQAVAAIPAFTRVRRAEESCLPHVAFAVNGGCALVAVTDWSAAGRTSAWAQLVVGVLLALPTAVRAARRAMAADRARTRTVAAGAAGAAALAAAAVAVAVLPDRFPARTVTALAVPAAGPTPVAAAGLPTVRARVVVPPSPGDIALAPDGRTALIVHRTRMAVSVLDTRLGQVTATIPTPQAPRFVAFCGGRAYLSMSDDPADPAGRARRLVGVLDTRVNAVVATVAVGARPGAAACSPDGAQLWVPTDDGRVEVVDTATNRLTRSVPVLAGARRLVFSADGRRVYVSCRDADVVAVLDPATSAVLRTIPVGASPHGGALSPDGTSLAVVDRGSAQVSVIDTARDVEVARLPTGEDPQDVAWSADGRLVYTANADGRVNGRPVGTVSVIDVASGGQSRLVTDGAGTDSAPTGIARSADGATGYVTNLRSGTVTVYALGR